MPSYGLFPSVCLTYGTYWTVHLTPRPLLFPCRTALCSETEFPLWGEEKARIRAFFFRAHCFGVFSRSFFFALSRSFFFALSRSFFFALSHSFLALRFRALFWLRAFALFFGFALSRSFLASRSRARKKRWSPPLALTTGLARITWEKKRWRASPSPPFT